MKFRNKFEGYLFAYFEGNEKRVEQEQLRFAMSEDATNWYALNKNRLIIWSFRYGGRLNL